MTEVPESAPRRRVAVVVDKEKVIATFDAWVKE
jgi:hypothetical protein